MLERTLTSAEAVRRRAQEFQRKEVAPLKIGLAPSISASLVLDPIAEIAKFVPGLRVELREGAAEELVDLLLEGKINAAMVGDVQDIPPALTTGRCSRNVTSRFFPDTPTGKSSLDPHRRSPRNHLARTCRMRCRP